jgi:hypothetical protein
MIDPQVRQSVVGKTVTNIYEYSSVVIIEFDDRSHAWIDSDFDYEYVGPHNDYLPVARTPVVRIGMHGEAK